MSASLVGSEMCIRDRRTHWPSGTGTSLHCRDGLGHSLRTAALHGAIRACPMSNTPNPRPQARTAGQA
eukprot:9897446-Alexandrium_andersonii.AAC.1